MRTLTAAETNTLAGGGPPLPPTTYPRINIPKGPSLDEVRELLQNRFPRRSETAGDQLPQGS